MDGKSGSLLVKNSIESGQIYEFPFTFGGDSNPFMLNFSVDNFKWSQPQGLHDMSSSVDVTDNYNRPLPISVENK